MTVMSPERRAIPAAALVLALLTAAAIAGDTSAFMPDGGRGTMTTILGPSPGAPAIRDALLTRRSETEWAAWLRARIGGLDETAVRTSAAWCALNLPLAAEPEPAGALAALPSDGRDLAWNGCAFCHSLYSGYLMQDRDEQGWRNIFESPFHRELGMSPTERETFARYSALNMPLPVESVPEGLRF
jgi:hypothetical protein